MTSNRVAEAEPKGSEADPVLVEHRSNGVVVLTFNRPQSLNAMNHALITSLVSAEESLVGRPDVRAVVLSGAGRAYMSGGDVIEMAGMSTAQFRAYIDDIQKFTRVVVHKSRVPHIAAIHGAAIGGGGEIATICDMRIASEDTIFSFPETGIGFTPTSGVTQLLPDLVGPSWTRRLLYLGDTISAQDAYEIGLIDKVVPRGEHLSAALALADQLISIDADALSRTRELLLLPKRAALETALVKEVEAAVSTFQQADTRQRLATRLRRVDGNPLPRRSTDGPAR